MITAPEAADLIVDGVVVAVSFFSGMGCPDAVLAAIGEHFRRARHPQNITSIHPIATGDMYGVRGVGHLAQPGLLAKVIVGSYPSGPSSAIPPLTWQMINDNAIPAWDLPSGILFDAHREAVAHRSGVLVQVGMDTYVGPLLQDDAVNKKAAQQFLVERVRLANDDWLPFPSIVSQVVIICATIVDERGNLTYEHEEVHLGPLEQATVARNNGGIIITQVKRQVAARSLKPKEVRISGVLVGYIVIAPEQIQATQTRYEPTIPGEISHPLSAFRCMKHGPARAIAQRVAQKLQSGDAVNIGFGVSVNVSCILLGQGRHGGVTWLPEQGAIGGVPLLEFQFGCAPNAKAFLPSPQQFTYFQGGGFDLTLISFL